MLNAKSAKVLLSVISGNQSAFVKGRILHDKVLLAQQVIQYMPKKVTGGNVALKIDMDKGYDRISWLGIIRFLRKFGFSGI